MDSGGSFLLRSVFCPNVLVVIVVCGMQVFRPVIQSGMEVTAEEIEEGLVSPDDTLAKLHIALLRVWLSVF